jgi:hypothetical protein
MSNQASGPAVYRFIAPDGRSYVGSRKNIRNRTKAPIGYNKRLLEALAIYPQDQWQFEILEKLEVGCSGELLREAEQRHIDRLQTFSPDFGFNVNPTSWSWTSKRPKTADPTPISKVAFTIKEFCSWLPISRAYLNRLWAEGKGPRRWKLGRKVLIDIKDAEEWRKTNPLKQNWNYE